MHTSWLRKAADTTFDALRTGNIPALDNAERYAMLLGQGEVTPRARAVVAAAARTSLPLLVG